MKYGRATTDLHAKSNMRHQTNIAFGEENFLCRLFLSISSYFGAICFWKVHFSWKLQKFIKTPYFKV